MKKNAYLLIALAEVESKVGVTAIWKTEPGEISSSWQGENKESVKCRRVEHVLDQFFKMLIISISHIFPKSLND